MGGKNPTIVLADADLDVAVDCVLNAAFFSTGQRCTATSRAIVEKGACSRSSSAGRARREAEGRRRRDPSTELGPAIDEKQLKTTLRYIDIGRQEGATLVHGGERLSEGAHANGWFSRPAIMTGVASKSKLGQDEIFGPLLGISKRRTSTTRWRSPTTCASGCRRRSAPPTSAARSSTSSAPRPAW